MYDILAPINFYVWTIFLIIYLIGNLTYADYYTKLNLVTKDTINWAFGILYTTSGINFLIACIDGNGAEYGLIWFTIVTSVYYISGTIISVIYGFTVLKKYFGKKRGKL